MAEKNLWCILMDTKLNMSSQCALAAKKARYDCTRNSVISSPREVVLPLS